VDKIVRLTSLRRPELTSICIWNRSTECDQSFGVWDDQ